MCSKNKNNGIEDRYMYTYVKNANKQKDRGLNETEKKNCTHMIPGANFDERRQMHNGSK